MDFDGGGGIAGGFGYGNGYTPAANNAIANNNASYWGNQNYANQVGQYNPFAGNPFGAQTAYYAGLGADYSRAVPQGNVFGPMGGGGGGGGGSSPDWGALMKVGMSPSDWNTFSQQVGADAANQWLNSKGIGSDAGQSPNQPAVPYQPYGPGYFDNTFGEAYANQQKAIDTRSGWSPYFNEITAPAQQQQPQQPSSQAPDSPYPYGGYPMNNPSMDKLLGYTPQTFNNPYASQPWWSTFEKAAGPQGVSDWLRTQGRDDLAKAMTDQQRGTQPQQSQQPFNPYGSDNGWGFGGFGMPGGVTGGGGYFGGKGQGSIGPAAGTDIYGNPTRSGDAPLYPGGVPGLPEMPKTWDTWTNSS